MSLLIAVGGTVMLVWFGRWIFDLQRELALVRNSKHALTIAEGLSVHFEHTSGHLDAFAAEVRGFKDDPENLDTFVGRFTNENSSVFSRLSVADRDGIVLSEYVIQDGKAVRGDTIGKSIAKQAYYSGAIANGDAFFSGAELGPDGEITVLAAVPFFGADGAVLGIVSGTFFAHQGIAVSEALHGQGLIPVVIDREGLIVSHPDAALIGHTNGFAEMAPAKQALLGLAGSVDSYEGEDGKTYAAAYTPAGKTGWAVWIAQDTSMITALKNEIILQLILLSLLPILFSAVLLFIFSNILFRPLERITEEFEEIGRGDFTRTVDLSDTLVPYEVDVLMTRLNRMVGRLKALVEGQRELLAVKTRFLEVVSHSFRTPITLLKWLYESSTSGIVQKGTSPGDRSLLHESHEALQRLQFGFDNVFTALEVMQDTVRLNVKKVDLRSLLENTIERLAELAKDHGVKIEFKADVSPEIPCDEAKLRKVFEVILANGIFYSEGKGKVTIRLSSEGEMAVVSVKDEGIGMTSREKEQLFTPFFRTPDAQTKFTDGTGLGLYIAQAFVKHHHGKIDISSKKGQGTTVTVRLPLEYKYNHDTEEEKK